MKNFINTHLTVSFWGCASQNSPYVMIIAYDKKKNPKNPKQTKNLTNKQTKINKKKPNKPCKFFQEADEAVQGSRGAII